VYCQVGQRGYLATRILQQAGFQAVNVSGGIRLPTAPGRLRGSSPHNPPGKAGRRPGLAGFRAVTSWPYPHPRRHVWRRVHFWLTAFRQNQSQSNRSHVGGWLLESLSWAWSCPAYVCRCLQCAIHLVRPAPFNLHLNGGMGDAKLAVSLVFIALFIFWEAIQRMYSPEEVNSGLMVGVAAIALLLNGIFSVWLYREAQHDLNVRGAYLHMLGDAISALGVVVAGMVVALTGMAIADAVVSVLIGLLILWSSWGILTEAVNVLLEAAPKDLDVGALEQALRHVPGVINAHDLHVWTVTSGIVACSCHIVVTDPVIAKRPL
jgi:hypothetical protein